jgi:hypothetical protein
VDANPAVNTVRARSTRAGAPSITTVLVQVNAVAYVATYACPVIAATAGGLGREAGAVSEAAGCLDIDARVGAGFKGVVGTSGHRESGGGGAEERDGAEEGAGEEHGCRWL